jgi:hypothetical protein
VLVSRALDGFPDLRPGVRHVTRVFQTRSLYRHQR